MPDERVSEPSGLEPAPPRESEQLEPTLGGFFEALRDAREQRAEDRRIQALVELGRRHDPRALPALTEALADRDWRVRKAAVAALGTLGDRAATDAVASQLEGPIEVRRAAARALKRLDDGRRLPLWLGLASDGDWQVRAAALEALEAYSGPGTIEALLAALDDPVWLNRYLALAALAPHVEGPFGPRLAPVLLDRLKTDAELAPWLAPALAPAAGGLLEPLLALLEGAPPWRRLAVATALGHVDDDRARDAIVGLFGHPDPEVESAVRQQGPRMRDRLLASLGHPDWVVRWHACLLLAQLDDRALGVSLLPLLQDARPEVRLAALDALARLADDRCEWDMLRAIEDASWHLRLGAVAALAGLATPKALDAVVDALTDARAEVRQAARRALAELGPAAEEALVSGLLRHPEAHDEIGWLLKGAQPGPDL